MDDFEDLAFQLFGRAEYVGIVLGELPNAQKAVQHAAFFVPVHYAKLEIALGHIAIAAHIVAVNQHVANAVHRLDAVFVFLNLREIHIFTIMIVMAGFLPGFHAQKLRALNNFIAPSQMLPAPKILQHGTDHHALWQPENHARRHILMKGKEREFAPKLSVVAGLCLFKLFEVGHKGLRVRKGSAINS